MITLADVHALAVSLEAEGKTLSANQIAERLHVSKRTAVPLLREYRGVPPPSPRPAPSPAPAPARPIPLLVQLRQLCAEDDEYAPELEREVQQFTQDRAEHRSAYRASLLEAQRLLPLFRRAHQVSQLALYAGDPRVQEEAQRLRQSLITFIGEAEVERLSTDPAYHPSELFRS
jgi:hypothetical protein